MNLKLLFSTSILLMALASCTGVDKKVEGTRTQFFDISGIDSTVKPGDNFFMYANGSWLKSTAIPNDQSGWGSYYILYEDNLKNLHSILEESANSKADKGSLEQKVGEFYISGMDTVAIEKVGAEPLKPMLAEIDAIKNYKELMNLMAEGYATGDGYLMGLYVNADDKNSTQNITIFYQSGLNLPEKEYYTRQDSASKAARKALTDYATKLFVLAGINDSTAAKNAQTVLAHVVDIGIDVG